MFQRGIFGYFFPFSGWLAGLKCVFEMGRSFSGLRCVWCDLVIMLLVSGRLVRNSVFDIPLSVTPNQPDY